MKTRRLREARKRGLDAAIRAAFQRAARQSPRVLAAFAHLLETVQERTRILAPRAAATEDARRLVGALSGMAAHRWDWKRPLTEWTPPVDASAVVALASLASHLFALFPVPRFMTAAWFATTAEQRWYVRLGAGESVRAIDFPVPLSRAMAHALRSAPDDLSVLEALRWAEVRGLGGSPELARAVARTRLGRETGAEPLFAEALRFLVEQERHGLDLRLADELVELVHARADALTSLAALWPAGSSPRRDLALCAVGPKTRASIFTQWGRPAAEAPRPCGLAWSAAPFGGLYWFRVDPTDLRPRAWRIRELRTSEALRLEGLAMRHCVATYASKCAFASSSIWSMTFEEEGRERRAVTIEVDRKRRVVCQVKGHGNARPKPRFLDVLRRWAEEQTLTLSRAVAPPAPPAR